VAVARDDLGAHCLRCEAERRERALLDGGGQVRVGSDGTCDLAHADLFPRACEAYLASCDFGVVAGEGEAERDRFGVDPVASTDHRGARVLPRAARERGEDAITARGEEIRCVSKKDCKRRVEHVARGHPAV
jgi:hypothetical protein